MSQSAMHAEPAGADGAVRTPDAEERARRIILKAHADARLVDQYRQKAPDPVHQHQHEWEFLQALPAVTENPGPTLPDRLLYSCTCGAVLTTYLYHGLGVKPHMRHEVIENLGLMDGDS